MAVILVAITGAMGVMQAHMEVATMATMVTTITTQVQVFPLQFCLRWSADRSWKAICDNCSHVMQRVGLSV